MSSTVAASVPSTPSTHASDPAHVAAPVEIRSSLSLDRHPLTNEEKPTAAVNASSEDGAAASPTAAAAAGGDPEKQAADAPPANPWADYPDGGTKAWLTVAGGFCCMFVSFGWINAIGIFQEYYQTTLLSEYSPSTISWITSLETFIMFFGGIWVGIAFDNYGPRPLLLVGMVLHVLGLMMASLGTEYWQILLAQGICSPLGASPVFYAAMSSCVTWFHKRRGMALGVMASGSSLGGVIFPIMVQRLIPAVGFPWAMRTAAFVILALLCFALFTVRSRVPPQPRPFHFRVFAQPFATPNFVILAVGCFCVFWGLFIPFTYVPLQALQAAAVSANIDQYLIPILNAASIFGRITPGWASDHLGRYNVTSAMCALCGILTLALWLPAAGTAPVVVFAVLYGFGSGAFVSLVPALVATVSPDMRQIGTNNGVLFAFISLAALTGTPIGGAIIGADGGRYVHVAVWAGVLMVAGAVGLFVVRLRLSNGKLLSKT